MDKLDFYLVVAMMITSLALFLMSAWSAPSWATGFAVSFWIYKAAMNTIKSWKK